VLGNSELLGKPVRILCMRLGRKKNGVNTNRTQKIGHSAEPRGIRRTCAEKKRRYCQVREILKIIGSPWGRADEQFRLRGRQGTASPFYWRREKKSLVDEAQVPRKETRLVGWNIRRNHFIEFPKKKEQPSAKNTFASNDRHNCLSAPLEPKMKKPGKGKTDNRAAKSLSDTIHFIGRAKAGA